jgi:hypothetical protein
MKIGPKILRIPAYGLCIGLAILTAYHLGEIDRVEQRELDIKVMKGQIEAFWDLEKEKVNLINNLAEREIKEKNLSPGDPLPPNSLLRKGINISALKKDTETKVLNTYTASSGEYSTKAISLLCVMDKVPDPDQSYAYAGIEYNREMFGKSYTTYPDDRFAYQRLKRALRDIAKLQENGSIQ